MKTITIISKTHGTHEVMVDDEDYDRVIKIKWHIRKERNVFYVASTILRKSILMHRFILGVTDPKIQVDHKDRDGRNNQRFNIRLCTNSQNQMNKKAKGASKYLGVSIARIREKYIYWVGAIHVNGKYIRLGYFKVEEDAAKAYDEAAKKYHGEWANLNFP